MNKYKIYVQAVDSGSWDSEILTLRIKAEIVVVDKETVSFLVAGEKVAAFSVTNIIGFKKVKKK